MNTNETFCCLAVGGVICGLSIMGMAAVEYGQKEQAATYAFVRGACGANLPSCYGDIEISTGSVMNGTPSVPYKIAHGAVFSATKKGREATLPVLLPAACTGIKVAASDKDMNCEFIPSLDYVPGITVWAPKGPPVPGVKQ